LVTGVLAAMAALLVALGGGAARAQESRSVDLDVEKTVHPRTVQVGDRQTFTIKITNDGTTRAQRVRMRDPPTLQGQVHQGEHQQGSPWQLRHR
jgi:uncharacterized repeat protein (TIGR01451 family)